mmetsp:Transcript_23984/g.76993  ORF Transcript_23984/g.76993 Transcript_23984/m.76993 type:complete len:258 (-) Transcript_23984:314-1087(-)
MCSTEGAEWRLYATTLPSSPPETTRSSSGAIARQLIGAEWPGSEVSIGWASETSHSRTTQSSEPVTNTVPALCAHCAVTPLTCCATDSCLSTCSGLCDMSRTCRGHVCAGATASRLSTVRRPVGPARVEHVRLQGSEKGQGRVREGSEKGQGRVGEGSAKGQRRKVRAREPRRGHPTPGCSGRRTRATSGSRLASRYCTATPASRRVRSTAARTRRRRRSAGSPRLATRAGKTRAPRSPDRPSTRSARAEAGASPRR